MLAQFTEGLASDVREAMERRRDVLTRGIRWHFEHQVAPVPELRTMGWSVELAVRIAEPK
jgi:hypothetical protein